MKKNYFLLTFLLFSLGSFGQNVGDIVITEFLNDSGAVSDTVGEWFEIYNSTDNPIDLNGWSLKDDGANLYVFTTSVVVPAKSYFVLGRGPADTSQNGGVNLDFSYGDNYTLANSDDEIIILSPSNVEIDRVNYGVGGFPDEGAGISISLDPTKLAEDNNLASNWCVSTSTFGDGDKGTPGAVNDACAPTCEASLGAFTTTCDAETSGTDTYTINIAFSGAGNSTFIVTSSVGTVGGDNPSTTVAGNIIITGINEGTDVTITMDNTADGGLCSLSSQVTSPICAQTGTVDLELKGIIDFTVPSGGSDGKAIHVVATAAIADLSVYGLGIANNGEGTDGQEYTFENISVNSGDNILVVRSAAAMESYFTTNGYNLFEHVLVDAGGSVSQNGDDAVELFKNGSVIETFGDVNEDATGKSWEYSDSWAYKTTAGASWPSGWTYGTIDCTDGSTTIFDSSCVYPFVSALSAKDLEIENLGLFPNPVKAANDFVSITNSSSEELNVTIYNVLGKKISSQKVEDSKLNISNLNRGLYLLKISQGNKLATKKLIIN